MVRSFAIICGIGLTLALCKATWAGAPLEYPRPCPNGCVPNVAGFGYFRTTWRQWPGEERLEQTNPKAIGAQVIPTPAGQEQLPLPPATVRPQPQPQPPQPTPEGGTLPPSGNAIPETILPEPPAEPKTGILPTPSSDGTLPGLPVEPGGAQIPGPFDAGPSAGSTSNSLPPSTPATKETARPSENVKPKEEPKQEPSSKDEPKPKTQPKSEEEPKPVKENKPTARVWQSPTEPSTASTTFDQKRYQSQDTGVPAAANETPAPQAMQLGSNRTNSMATKATQSPASSIQPATYPHTPTRDLDPAAYASLPTKAAEPAVCTHLPTPGVEPAVRTPLPTRNVEPANYAALPTKAAEPTICMASPMMPTRSVEPAIYTSTPTKDTEPAINTPASKRSAEPAINTAVATRDAEPVINTPVTTRGVEAAVCTAVPNRNVEPAAYATAESAGQLEVSDQCAAPPVALGGYCPVELMSGGRWLMGDLRWTVVYQGHIYRMSGPTQRQQFLADPESFAPVYSGNDPVLAVDQNRMVPGQTTYCATYNNRLYMFSNAGTQAQFNQNPQQYAMEK